jgi:hypothetical protein
MSTKVKSSGLDSNLNLNVATVNTANFTITESSGKLVIKYGANTVFSIDSTGVIKANTSFIAGTTP